MKTSFKYSCVKGCIVKVLFLCILIAFSTGSIDAQSRVQTFFGIELGMAKSQVTRTLKQRSIPYDIEYRNGREYFEMKNIELAGYYFDTGILSFKNGILVLGLFYKLTDAGGNPSGSAFSAVERNAKTYKNMFNDLYSIFATKYGEPRIAEDEQYIWTKGNKLKLEYKYTDSYDSPYMRQAMTQVSVLYTLNSPTGTDY